MLRVCVYLTIFHKHAKEKNLVRFTRETTATSEVKKKDTTYQELLIVAAAAAAAVVVVDVVSDKFKTQAETHRMNREKQTRSTENETSYWNLF